MLEFNALNVFLCILVLSLCLLLLVRRYWFVDSNALHPTVSRTKHVDLQVDLGSNVGVKSIRGARPYMEDMYQVKHNLTNGGDVAFYGVFDGHGGARASEFAFRSLASILKSQPDLISNPHRALITAFQTLDREWLHEAELSDYDDGSTAIVALIVKHTLYLANLGDCRAVLSRHGVALDMSHDHKPIRKDEKERIEKLGGKIIFHGTWRVQGALAVTRAFGDRKYKKYITATPEVSVRQLREDDHFLILASDGVWDVLSSQDAVDVVHDEMSLSGSSNDYCIQAAIKLADTAYLSGSMDNITALVVDLNCHLPTDK